MGRKNKAAAAVGSSAGIVKRKKFKDESGTDADFGEAPNSARTKRVASPSSGSEPDVAVEQRRVSPRWLVEALKLLNDRQLRVVEEMGFGQLIHLQVEAVPGKLVHWCLERFQPRSCSLRLPKNEQLHIDADDVYHIFGFPKGPLRIDKKCSSNDNDIEEEWVERIGKQKNKILPSDVVAAMLAGSEGGDWFRRQFLILVESCLFENAADGYIKPKIMDILRDLSQIRHHNWCEHMISVLQRSHERWLANKTNKFTGPSVFIALFYVDRMVHRKREVARVFPLLKGWTSEALRMRQRAELEKKGFGSGFVDKRYMVEESHMIEESTHGNGREVPALCGGQGISCAGLSEPQLYTQNLIKAAKQVADAMAGLMTKLLDAPMHIRQAPIFNNAVQATSALLGVKCKEETAHSAHVVGCSQKLLAEVRGTMEWEIGIDRVMEVIEERERLEEYLGYLSFSLGITQEVKEAQPVCSQFEKAGVMDEVEVSKSIAELEDLGSPIYILGQEGEVAPWIEQGNDQTPQDFPPLDCTTNELDYWCVSEGLAPASFRGDRLSCPIGSLVDHPAAVNDRAARASGDISSVVKIFFPICHALHFFVVVLDLKQRRVVLLDNSSAKDGEPVTVMYGDIPSSVAKYFCEWMMANNNHEKGRMMINQPIKRLALPWRDEENKVDCGVFAMRHMETYMEQRVCDWKIGLSGLAAKAIQNLRIKYVKTLLVSEANDLCKDNIARVQAWFKGNRHVHFDKFVGVLNRSNR